MDIGDLYYVSILVCSITAAFCIGLGTGSFAIGSGCFIAVISINTAIHVAARRIIKHLREIKS